MEHTEKKRARGRPRSLFHAPSPKPVQALDRAMALLLDLADSGSATLTEIASRIGMPASSAHRVLTTLQARKFVELDEASQKWAIGIETFRVGSVYLKQTNVAEAARPVLRRLVDDTGETANLAIADDGDVVFIGQIETHQPIRAFFRPGTRGHMHSSGIGKALLADLPRTSVEKILRHKGLPEFTNKTLTSPERLFANLDDIRARGWSLDDEERYLGMRCVAASIYNAFGEAIAGISISGPTIRFTDAGVPELGPKVADAALEVTKLIGGVKPLV